MLYQDRIAQLGWPEHKGQSQRQYISKLLINGFTINSKQCHYIGINHLHSILPKLNERGFPCTVEHKKVIDPATGKLSPTNVDSVHMTQEQRQEWLDKQAEKRKLRPRK
ncbi:MAG: hypothetical protein ACTIM4_08560 [Marinomonas sp.]